MNYGIKEIEEFKAPSRKPWLVLLVFVVLGLTAWQTVRLIRARAQKADRNHIAPAGTQVVPAVTATTVRKQAPKPPADRTSGKDLGEMKKPPVDLKAENVPAHSKNAEKDLMRAKAMVAKGNRVGARELLLGQLDSMQQGPIKDEIENLLGDINVTLAFLPYDMPEKVDHVVERGDSLDKMSKKYGVTVESIQIGNDLKNPNLIKAGDHLRVLDADFSLDVYKARHELVLKMNGRFFKKYKVGLGKFDKTPQGTFEIYDRIVKPVWWRPDGKEFPFGDKENILGTRWMAIRATGETPPIRGYGIHGTWDDASIGKSESAGCVRMHNKDVEEIFNLVPLGTKVTIHK